MRLIGAQYLGGSDSFAVGNTTKVVLYAEQSKYRNMTAYKAKPYDGRKPVAFGKARNPHLLAFNVKADNQQKTLS